jgi:enediyne biosynthesis protein E4
MQNRRRFRGRRGNLGIRGVAALSTLFASMLLVVFTAEAQDQPAPTTQPPAESTVFRDITVAAGVETAHQALLTSIGIEDYLQLAYRYLITGQAWGDYDQDGWVDLYLTNQDGANTLYRNRGDGTFLRSALSEAVGLPGGGSGGAVFADYDNDGWPDLYVTRFGQDTLFHNERGTGFTDLTRSAGIDDGGRGMTASWGDYDNDGFLDLYVANAGCHPCDSPRLDQGDLDRLWHNDGDGTFSDVTAALPATPLASWGFSAGWFDYDADADLDLYLVNDVRDTRYLPPSALFRNDGPGCGSWCFADISKESGADVRTDGMGLAIGDYDRDLDLDLYVTNTGWAHGPLTGPAVLLANQGDGTFADVSRAANADVEAISWGPIFLDYDNDGWQDLYVALGGDPEDIGPWVTADRLLHNQGDGAFVDVSATSGTSFPDDTFGVAAADYNHDGWVDLVVGNINDGYRLYANTGAVGSENHRLTVQLQGSGTVNRDAVGSQVYLTTPDGQTQMQQVMAGSSLGAGHDLALHFGLGQANLADVRVVWPDGHEQAFSGVPADVRWQLSYGGDPVTTPLLAPSKGIAPATAEPAAVVDPSVRTGGYLVPLLALLATLGLAAWLTARHVRLPATTVSRMLFALVIGVLIFQLAHFIEHVMQFGYWLLHPGRPPWITPWGRIATDGLAALSGHHGGRATGTELLHLSGNWITFVGIAAAFLALRGWNTDPAVMRAATWAFWLQLVHVAEHVSLTTTFFTVGTPIGLSTLFGRSFLLEGAWAPSIRIWWHFTMVVATTVLLVLALRDLQRGKPGRMDTGRGNVHSAPTVEMPGYTPAGGMSVATAEATALIVPSTPMLLRSAPSGPERRTPQS